MGPGLRRWLRSSVLTAVVLLATAQAESPAPGIPAPPSIATDVLALLAVKEGFGGAASILDDWSAANASKVCSWTGVQCGESGRVTNITFISVTLQGVLSPAIANLTELEVLKIYNAPGLGGPLPKELGALSKLRLLDLCSCAFTGGVPRELGQLAHLGFFSLAQNTLSGTIPSELTSLTNLTYFSFFANNLTGPIPQAIGRLARLETLTLQYNSLTGPVPAELSNCTNLKTLDLSVNELTGGLPPQLGALPSLAFLDLASNNLTGGIPGAYGGLPALASLSLSKNALTGPIPDALGGLEGLQMLDLSRNGLSGAIPESLGAAANLSYVDLSMNDLKGRVPESFSNLRNLTAFNASGNQLSGPVPPGALSSLDPSSFANNSGLCGPPLTKPCSDDEEIMGAAGIAGTVVGGAVLLGIAISSAFKFGHSRRPAREFANGQVRLFQPLGYAVTVDDLVAATDGFSKKHLLGAGGSSRVYWARLADGKTEVAVKRFLDARARGVSRQFHAETRTLSTARHANLVTLVGSYLEEASGLALLVYNFLPGGDLETWLAHAEVRKEGGPGGGGGAGVEGAEGVDPRASRAQPLGSQAARLARSGSASKSSAKAVDGGAAAEAAAEATEDPLRQWWVRYKIALGAARGLKYLHHECKPPIIHRDIKTANIFLDDDLNAYVGDFGLSKVVADGPAAASTAAPDGTNRSAVVQGTVGYLAPESVRRGKFTRSADVYSFGVVVLELLTGVHPTGAEVPEEGYPEWVRARAAAPGGVFDPRVSLGGEQSRARGEALAALQIALDCTAKEPGRRPAMSDVVRRLEEVRNFHVEVVVQP